VAYVVVFIYSVLVNDAVQLFWVCGIKW